MCFLISEIVIIKKGEIVEAKLHGESKVIVESVFVVLIDIV